MLAWINKKILLCITAIVVMLAIIYRIGLIDNGVDFVADALPDSPRQAPLQLANGMVLLEETAASSTSSSRAFWLNSGGIAYLNNQGGMRTFAGTLPSDSVWKKEYAAANPTDTDNGIHPQNIFRIITLARYENATHEGYFKVNKTIKSRSPNRNASNGFFMMMRYRDSDDLYYAGLRIDGMAVIKKKIEGKYHTLATHPVFSYAQYNSENLPNLIPEGVWIGLRTDSRTQKNGSVTITISMDIGRNGTWVPVLSVTDAGATSGPALTGPGSGGIRSDFMEIEVEGFEIR